MQTEVGQAGEVLHDLEAERALIGAALVAGEEVLDQVNVPPEAFYEPSHARVWEAMQAMLREGQVLDVVAVALRAGVGVGEAARFLEVPVSALAAPAYAERVRSLWLRRRSLEAVSRAQVRLLKGETFEAVLPDLVREWGELAADAGREPVSLEKAGEELARHLGGMEESEERPIGIVLSRYGSELMSIAPGELHLLAASTGVGKSAIALQIARAANGAGWPVVIYSLEMAAKEWAARYLSQREALDPKKARYGGLTQEDWKKLQAGLEDMRQRKIYIHDNLFTLEAILADLRRQVRRLGVKLAIVDYMGLVQAPPPPKGVGRWQVLEEIASALKRAALQMKIGILAIHQLNRLGETERNGGLHLWGDSYGMLRPADGAYILLRKREKGEGGARLSDEAEWRREKVRHGALGVLKLRFDAERISFVEEGHRDY